MDKPADGKPTAVGRVRAFIRTQMIGVTDLHLPALLDDAVEFVQANKGLNAALLRELMRDTVYEQVQRTVATTRPDLMLLGEDLVGKDELIASASVRWGRWFEHTRTRHVIALEMTRQDCEEAAAQRMLAAERHLALGRLWRSVASDLDEDQRVGQRFTPVELEARLQQIQAMRMDLTLHERTWARRLLGRRSLDGA